MKFRPISEKKLRAMKLLAAQRRKEFSEMEFQATNADKSYFNRSWKREDLINFARTPEYSHRILKRVYLTLFSTMLAATYGSYVHLIWEVGGLYIVFSSVASLLCLLFTSWRVNHRVSLLMVAAFFLGASGGLFTKYFLKIDEENLIFVVFNCEAYILVITFEFTGNPLWQIDSIPCLLSSFVVKLLAAAAIVFGCFWSAAWTNRERSQIYVGGLFLTFNLTRFLFDSYTAHLVLKLLWSMLQEYYSWVQILSNTDRINA